MTGPKTVMHHGNTSSQLIERVTREMPTIKMAPAPRPTFQVVKSACEHADTRH